MLQVEGWVGKEEGRLGERDEGKEYSRGRDEPSLPSLEKNIYILLSHGLLENGDHLALSPTENMEWCYECKFWRR